MGPNHIIEFPFRHFNEYMFEEMPKGNLLRLGINPYTGKVILNYMDGGTYAEVCSKVLEQIGTDLHYLRITRSGKYTMDDYANMVESGDMSAIRPEVIVKVHERYETPKLYVV